MYIRISRFSFVLFSCLLFLYVYVAVPVVCVCVLFCSPLFNFLSFSPLPLFFFVCNIYISLRLNWIICICILIDNRWHECSNFLNFLSDHDRIVTSNFRRAQFPIVERAFVLITVSMYRAIQATTSALETSQSNFLAAGCASVLLLLAVFVTVLVVSVGGVITRGSTATRIFIIDFILDVGGTEDRTVDCGLCGVRHRDRRDWGGAGGDGGCGGGGCCAGVDLRCDYGADVGGGSGNRTGSGGGWRGRTGSNWRRTADWRLLLFS